MYYEYKTRGTCSTKIEFDINDDIITNVVFTGGCNGNLKAISKLVDGFTVSEIVSKLEGNTCGMRNTSCADQLSKAVLEAYEKSTNKC